MPLTESFTTVVQMARKTTTSTASTDTLTAEPLGLLMNKAISPEREQVAQKEP